MDDPNQDFQPAGILSIEEILFLSWDIRDDPTLYQEVAPNPYSPRSQQIISERFPHVNIIDCIRAVILAEPEGRCDRNFEQLSKELQEREVLKQENKTSEMMERLSQYHNLYKQEFRKLSADFIYDLLYGIAFETANTREVEKRYGQNQRKYIKGLIVHYIGESQRQLRIQNTIPPIISSKERVRLFKSKTFSRLALVALSSFTFFYLSFVFLDKQAVQAQAPRASQKTEQTVPIENQKTAPGLPVRLKIPHINVDATVQNMDVTPEGEMEVPKSTADAGWFKLGVRPGEKGSAVIGGHLNGEKGEEGVFVNLYKLKAGDTLYIEDDQGKTTSFVVRESRIYDPGYAEDVFNRSDGIHLNLITCVGIWDGEKKSYSKRLVVFADSL